MATTEPPATPAPKPSDDAPTSDAVPAPVPEPAPAAVPASAPDAVNAPEPAGGTPPPEPLSASEDAPEAVPAPVPEPAPAATPALVPDAVSGTAPMPDEPGGDAASRGGRRWRGIVRWAAAVTVFAVVGGGVAYGVTQPARDRIPGLHTPSDGRWTYPPISLPKLPADKPRPLADENLAGRHFVDIRSLLLPAPLGATVDRGVPGGDGWLPVNRYLDAFSDMTSSARDTERVALRADGLRHIAARSWTMPDGTRTDVYLLQFTTAGYAWVNWTDVKARSVKGEDGTEPDKALASTGVISSAVERLTAVEVAPHGPTTVDHAWLHAGDTIALVVQSRKGTVNETSFRQTAILQAQLLS